MTTSEDFHQSCVACKLRVETGATICPHCGTYQQKWRRVGGRTVVLLSAAAALLSLVTAAVALYPQAVSVAFPRSTAELLMLSFDAVSHRREQARIEIINTGNQDLHLNSLVLSVDHKNLPKNSQELAKNPRGNYVISEWLRVGEARIFLIPLKRDTTTWVVRSIENFDATNAAFVEKGRDVWRCFSILPMSMRSGEAITPEEFIEVDGLVGLTGEIRYTTASKSIVDALSLDLPFRGALFERQHPKCKEVLDHSMTD
ncbi:hypothetical protein SAMN04488105_1365 [Salipiger thiooxidans]|uniref:Uncharacterized protein n=1 Tax=Salipiger thiooxidans TaxID=282683 RepID=A0A1G7MI91_9RHOB|nr:hypothetical protein [Salipiger thiooxidans]SDF61485.1 hypothetical protein SAMN04488105_1365 [Salipiger thiooxidans]